MRKGDVLIYLHDLCFLRVLESGFLALQGLGFRMVQGFGGSGFWIQVSGFLNPEPESLAPFGLRVVASRFWDQLWNPRHESPPRLRVSGLKGSTLAQGSGSRGLGPRVQGSKPRRGFGLDPAVQP